MRIRFSRIFGALVGFGAAIGCGYAQQTLYASSLFTVDELSGSGTPTSTFGLQAGALALGPGGVMYGESYGTNGYSGEVVTLNRNGTTTPFAQIPGYSAFQNELVYNPAGGNFFALDYNIGADGPSYPNNIYSISSTGVVTLFASIDGSQTVSAQGFALAPNGDLYVALQNPGGMSIDKVAPNGTISVFDSHLDEQAFHSMAFDSNGNLFYGASTTVQEITPAGVESTYANMPTDKYGYDVIEGLAFNSSGELFASDSSTELIYQILPSSACVEFSSMDYPATLEFGNATPEPSATLVLGVGILGLCWRRRKGR